MKAWIDAARPRTLPLAWSSVITGNALAFHENASQFSYPVFILAALTTALLQILSNLANDLGDGEKGTDGKGRIGPARAIQSGTISVADMKTAVGVFSFLSFVSGVCLLWQAFERQGWLVIAVFLLLGLISIAAALYYTMGKFAYGYRALGDAAVFLFFGLLGVLGNFYLQTGSIQVSALFGALVVGSLSTGVLNLNNMRDRDSDQLSKKWTVAVILGFKRSKWYHYALMVLAILALVGLGFSITLTYWSLLLFIPVVFLMVHSWVVAQIQQPADFDPLLKQLALICFLFSLLLSLQVILIGKFLPLA